MWTLFISSSAHSDNLNKTHENPKSHQVQPFQKPEFDANPQIKWNAQKLTGLAFQKTVFQPWDNRIPCQHWVNITCLVKAFIEDITMNHLHFNHFTKLFYTAEHTHA